MSKDTVIAPAFQGILSLYETTNTTLEDIRMNTKRILLLTTLAFAALLLTACGAATAEAEARDRVNVQAADSAETAVSDHDAAHADETMHAEGAHHDDDLDDGHDHTEGMPHMHVETPDEFAGLANPFAEDADAILAGAEIFATNCTPCHGETGEGDGPAAAGLDPKPADLADGAMMGMAGDDYLFWRVTAGGTMEPFNSAMPSWEQVLTEEQRWQVISYIRTLSSEHMDTAGGHMHDGGHTDGHAD